MAQLKNIFVSGRMDSDKHNSFQDDKGYKHAENVRPSGKGEDGAVTNIKGSEVVSTLGNESGMIVLGAYEGDNNKNYFFRAMPNGKSQIIEYDTLTSVSKIIIEDSTVLRFDKIRWNSGVEIIPYKFILSINQIGDLLIFSNEIWRNVRVVNLTRLNDYSLGFTEEDITLNKKPPKLQPAIITKEKSVDAKDNEIGNRFVSFAYRYKYNNNDFSALSFYSEVAFEEDFIKGFKINSERLNEGMVNRFNKITLMVNSGGKNVTDIEVYAREHGSNTAYRIYSANKKKSGIADNVDITDIVYKFSNNYIVLDEPSTNMLYSNSPLYPKAQTVAGNRVIFGNYKEGDDLEIESEVDFIARKKSVARDPLNTNPTAVSLFNYKVAVVYLNDYNYSTTALLPVKEGDAEVEMKFEDRLTKNSIEVVMNSAPPSWATKMKFAVKSETLNYDIFYTSIMRKVLGKLYLKLEGDNVSKLKEKDLIIPISEGQVYNEYSVEEIKSYSSGNELTLPTGRYVVVNAENIVIEQNAGGDINKVYNNKESNPKDQAIHVGRNDNNPARFVSYQSGSKSIRQRTVINYSDIGAIKAGDSVKLTLFFDYFQQDVNDSGTAPSIEFDFPSDVSLDYDFFADKDYANVGDLIKSNFESPLFEITTNPINVVIDTTTAYADYIRDNRPQLYEWKSYRKNALSEDWRMALERTSTVNLRRGTKPIIFRTKNDEALNEYYFETSKTYLIQNGQYIPDYTEAGKPVFNIGFFNGWTWGNGVESYKIKDAFLGKKYTNNFRGTQVETKGYKRIHRKFDLTYSGIYNYELGINFLSTFNPTLANYKELPIHYGEIQRIISTDGDITVFNNNKVIQQLYGKSIIMDLTGNENVGISNEVLGDYIVLPYEFGISENPESVAKYSNLVFFTDKNRGRILMKQGNQIEEVNGFGGGFYYEGIQILKNNHTFLGSYDEANNEYIISLDLKNNIGFSLNNKGFSLYYTYKTDYNLGSYGKYYTAYKGVIYENEATDFYNNFAGQGVQQSKLMFVSGAEYDSDKIYKAIQLISNQAWDINVKTNYTESFMPSEVLEEKESYFFTEIFRNNNEPYHTASGIGNIKNISGGSIFVDQVPSDISVGDVIAKGNEIPSVITAIEDGIIKISNTSGFSVDDYIFSFKKQVGNYTADGEPIRGKWMEVTLTNSSSDKVYLTGVNAEVIKSYL